MAVNNRIIGRELKANNASSVGIWYLDEQQQADGAGNWVRTLPAVPPPPAFSATGGGPADGLAPGNGFKYHTFTASGTFTVTGSTNIEVLVVAGGGGGGYFQSGGGGAGGLAYNPATPVTTGPYPIVVGSGGPGAPGGSATGNDSTAFGITAKGGGRGGSRSPGNQAGSPGGSGGGAGSQEPSPSDTYSATQPSQPQPAGTTNRGNPGGGGSANNGPVYGGGGGGGAGGAGGNGSSNTNGPGGAGYQYPGFTGPLIGLSPLNPYSGFFAGGGGAAGNDPPAGSGGSGGGGAGNNSPGVNFLGGGGGGNAGTGGTGIVVIRYPA